MFSFRKSPWIIHYDASSCNGCDIETLACLTPVYDVERLGVINTGNPKHADIFLVTGAVNEQCREVIKNIYSQLPEPKVVVAVGACAATGGIFRDCYNISGGVDTVIPVDLYVPGCAARPEVIIDGVIKAVAVLEEKQRTMAAIANSIDRAIIQEAGRTDLPEILALQKICYRSEAEIYGDDSLPALQQTLAEMEADCGRSLFLKAVVNGKIIASIRARAAGGTVHVSRLIVHPYFRGRGLGARLIGEIEGKHPTARRFEAYTGHKSKRNLHVYGTCGYRPFRTETFSPSINWVYLEKTAGGAA